MEGVRHPQVDYEKALLSLHNKLESNPEYVYNFLYPQKTLDIFIEGNAINFLGLLHDASDILDKKQGLEKVINLGSQLQRRDLSPEGRARLEYTLGNAQTGILRISGDLEAWRWKDEEVSEIIRRYRKALDSEGAKYLKKEEIQKSYTNLGNTLSNRGRWIEAINNWQKALAINPDFYRADGQIGMSLVYYARHLSGVEKIVLYQNAYEKLHTALIYGDLHTDMEATFLEQIRWVENNVDPTLLNINIDLSDRSLGVGKEKEYRKWCLEKGLFLNPINDVSTEPVAAQDNLHLPVKDPKDNKTEDCIELLNQIKQEYVSSRYELWKGTRLPAGHYSDKGVRKSPIEAYPHESLNVELVKSSFKSSYSIFDKIAKIIDHYFDLNYIKKRKLSLDNVWYKSQGKNQVASEFQGNQNWPLRGLFWLSKDLEFNTLTVEKSLEPGAEKLRELRNQIEHGYVRVLTEFSRDLELSNRSNNLSKDIHWEDLKAKCAEVMMKARESIIYLILGLNKEVT
jgi:tetratricopeptide (TPR) repeat protein